MLNFYKYSNGLVLVRKEGSNFSIEVYEVRGDDKHTRKQFLKYSLDDGCVLFKQGNTTIQYNPLEDPNVWEKVENSRGWKKLNLLSIKEIPESIEKELYHTGGGKYHW